MFLRCAVLRSALAPSFSTSPKKIINSPLSNSILAKIERGDLLNDDRQVAAMNALSNVQNVLIKGGGGGVVASSPSSGNDDQGGPTKLVKGAFIYGSVGTGKSMLMDEFFSTLPSTIENKKRVHFHSFMNEVHQRIHKFKKADIDKHGRSFHIDVDAAKKEDGRNAVYQVGLEFAREANVLCFDEFQVTDIADASILSQLLSTMVRNGVVMVSTSNRSPQELYLGGINREFFLPCIEMIEAVNKVVDMNSDTDYRMNSSTHDSVFFRTATGGEQRCEEIFDSLLAENCTTASFSTVIDVMFGRTLKVPKCSADGESVCVFDFDELCKKELGAADFRAVAQAFRVVILKNIPLMTLSSHNSSRRFITLIDELYEAQCCVVCSAEEGPLDVFSVEGDGGILDDDRGIIDEAEASGTYVRSGTMKDPEVDRFNNSMMAHNTNTTYQKWFDVKQSNGMVISELSSVRELKFAFQRASSRLVEMTSREYFDRHKLSSK